MKNPRFPETGKTNVQIHDAYSAASANGDFEYFIGEFMDDTGIDEKYFQEAQKHLEDLHNQGYSDDDIWKMSETILIESFQRQG